MKKILAVLLVLMFLLPVLVLAQEKGKVKAYDEGTRMLTVTVGDKDVKAKVSKDDAAGKKDLLKEGTKVMVEFEGEGANAKVKSIAPR